jgi:hypothetical protein
MPASITVMKIGEQQFQNVRLGARAMRRPEK